ncbi:MAG TPA: hypothetical protein VFR09_04405 [Alphaproteobacteria bacterium]|nr:hypothetical protein [Alphaproteobacteria bacterium]
MKKALLALALIAFALPAHAQTNLYSGSNSVAIGTNSPTVGAALDLGSNTNSMLLPVGTTGQRPGTAANGMLRYNSTTPAVEAYVNNAWTSLATSGGGGGNFQSIHVQSFTSGGTYTPSSGMLYSIVEIVGGGGGGGSDEGGGGGSGGYAKALLTAVQIGTSQSITIGSAGSAGSSGSGGSGGTTSVGTLLSCDGGGGGGIGGDSSAVPGGSGGSASVTTGTALLTLPGQKGGGGGNNFMSVGGGGGGNPLGYGGAMVGDGNSYNTDGVDATGYGAGGGGAAGGSTGGSGTAGYVLITEFCNQ